MKSVALKSVASKRSAAKSKSALAIAQAHAAEQLLIDDASSQVRREVAP
jgi:hypothetical protein